MRPTTIHKISKLVGRPQRDCIYDIIGYLDLDLCVDVGAAAGDVTRRLRQVGGRHTQVVAFEPFPGNHGYFYDSIRDLQDVELVKKAVTDRIGRASFTVPSVVKGTEQGWEKRAGYSSVGFLSDGHDPAAGVATSLRRAGRRLLDKLLKPPMNTLVVDTTSIDQEFAGKKIDFIKVDVQGGEAQVLRGAASMLSARQIDILYVEWSGDPAVVQSLSDSNYWICDSTYVVGCRAGSGTHTDVAQLEGIGFRIVDELKLSTGGVAYELLLVHDDVSPSDAMSRVKVLGLPWIQTDLIAVSDQSTARFMAAVQQYSDAQSASNFDADV